jgi:hypothetical protein
LKTIATDVDFYTLSCSPRDYKQANRWHNVRVTVDGGPYTLSYRTGYYGDGIDSPYPKDARKARTLLTSDGEKAELIPSSSSVSEGTLAVPVRDGESLYTIR